MSTSVDRHWQRAQRYIAENQIAAAKVTLESIVNHAPYRNDARMMLASVMLSEGTVRNAAEQAVIASQQIPNDAKAISTVAHALLRVGETNAARDMLNRFDPNFTRDGSSLTAVAHAYQMLGDHAKALALMDRARGFGFDNADFRYYRALELQFNGRLEDARIELETCLKLGPTYGRASLTLARMRKQTAESNHLDYIRQQLRTVAKGSEDHASFKFAEFRHWRFEQMQTTGMLCLRDMQPNSAFSALHSAVSALMCGDSSRLSTPLTSTSIHALWSSAGGIISCPSSPARKGE